MTKKSTYLSVLAACSALCGPVFGQAPVTVEGRTDVDQVAVSYGDLDLTSEKGRHTIAGRVERAAGRLCLTNNSEPLSDRLARRKCFDTAMKDAGSQVDRAVTAYAAGLPRQGSIKIARAK